MSDRNSRQTRSRGAVQGSQVALGVQWSPVIPKRRRPSPRLLLPGQRRIGGARRRGRRSDRQPSASPASACSAHVVAVFATALTAVLAGFAPVLVRFAASWPPSDLSMT